MALLSVIRDLHRRKARERRGLALAEGVRLVEEMVAAGARCKGAAVSPALDATERGTALRAALANASIPLLECSDDDLADAAATEHPQGVIAAYEPRRWTIAQMLPRAGAPLVVLDGVQDPGNVGTIARTAHAFGASGLVALSGSADLTNPKTVRAAMGALFRLPAMHGSAAEIIEAVRNAGAEVWVAAMEGSTLTWGTPAEPVALVLGNEGAGVSDVIMHAAARTVTIPIHAGAESLNVAVAAGIALHALTSPMSDVG